MVKKRLLPLLLLCTMILCVGNVQASGAIGVIGGADGPTAIFVSTSDKNAPADADSSKTEEESDDASLKEETESDSTPAGNAQTQNLATAAPTASASPAPTTIPTPAPVSNEQIQIRVTLGYDGMLGMMRSMPILVEVTNQGPDLEDVMLGVNVFENTTVYNRYDVPVSLVSGATKRYAMTIVPRIKQDYYAFEIVSNGRILAEERVVPTKLVAPETVFVGLLAPDAQPLSYFSIDPMVNLSLRSEAWTTVALNPDNFPSNADSMRALSILVVDGVDVRTLSDAQRSTLVSWMQAGGMVILGGGTQASVNYPYFAAWTGLESDGLEQVEDFSSVLADYAQFTVPAIGQKSYRNLVVGDASPLLSNGEIPLVYLTPVGSGVLYTATFDLSTKPMVTWTGARGLWQRIITSSAQTVYLSEIDRLQSYSYDRLFYGVQNITQNMPIDNTDPSRWVLVLLGGYLLLVGFGCYFLLKRLDKREWMWLTIPACAVLALGAMLFIAKTMTLNDPVAVSFAFVQMEDGKTDASGYVGISTPNTDEILISSDHELTPYQGDNYYYDYSDGDTPVYRPLTLRQRYIQGDVPAIGYPQDAAWSLHLLRADLPTVNYGEVAAKLWMEADGVHGSIENSSDYALEEGYVFTPFGYSLIDALLPGQSTTFLLALTANPEQWINRYGEVPPDTMVFNMSTANGFYLDMYTYISSALTAKAKAQPEFALNSSVYSTHNSMLNMCAESWDSYNQPATFHYVTFSDSIGQQTVSLNGKAVTRTAHQALVDIRMDYRPVGPTGEVFIPAGIIVPEVISGQITSNAAAYGKPTFSSYLSLNDTVELRFALPVEGTLELDTMSLSGEYYDPMPTLWMFDNIKQEWIAQSAPFVTMDADGWAPYLSDDNVLLARYTATRSNGNYNSEMMIPRLILKGRVK